jgi:hypothetical protein
MVRNTKTESFARRTHNKQLQRTVIRRRGDGASAPFHYALAPRITRQRAAAELRRYTEQTPLRSISGFAPNSPLAEIPT